MSGKSKVLKLVTGALLLMILTIAGYIYIGFWGNPFVKMTMRSKVMDYLGEAYPSTEFIFERATYNFKVGTYGGVVYPTAEPKINVHVDRAGNGEFRDNFLRARLENEMLAAVKPLIEIHIPDPNIFSTVLARNEALDPQEVHFSPNMDADIFLVVRWKGESISKEAFAGQVTATVRLLQDGNWNIDNWLFCYSYDKTELLLSLDEGQFELDSLLEQVRVNTVKD